MQMRLSAITLAVLGGVSTLWISPDATAGNVGYFKNVQNCTGGSPANAITAAGHTPIAIGALDAASLAPLDGLVYDFGCSGNFVGNAQVDTAVANGMALFLNLHLASGDNDAAAKFPGAPALTVGYACSVNTRDTDLAANSPIATGMAGTLTNASLDSSTYCSSSGYVTSGPLPTGFTPLLTSQGNVTAFTYSHGSGTVVVGLNSLMAGLPGGQAPGYAPGIETYYSNTVEFMMGETTPATTCASEGYTGTKLNWCRIICESESSSSTIDTYLRRWINKYRDLPYCAVEGGGEEPPPSQG